MSSFRMNDITLANWSFINAIGQDWLEATDEAGTTMPPNWAELLPALDLWLRVSDDEVHQVSSLIPTLDWTGGLLGVRVAIEPKDTDALYRDFREAWRSSDRLKNPIEEADAGVDQELEPAGSPLPGSSIEAFTSLRLWPNDLVDFLGKRLGTYFVLNHYVLDPAKLTIPENNLAAPQELPDGALVLGSNPLENLIRIDEINAQRGLGERRAQPQETTNGAVNDSAKLSKQLSDYYSNHLNPSELPDISDLAALGTIADAQHEFDKRLAEAFKDALLEMENLGYPGVTDPRILVASKLSTSDSLNHESAVSFAVDVVGEAATDLQLPEGHNGLGYQNLISMVFRLMSFRDRWMRVGKADQKRRSLPIEPIHLVLIEEPEAHLHVQVQQVFAKKAFDVLRNHADLGESSRLTTQLVISTHSSHVAHELPFSALRYFRRLPAGSQKIVPTSSVISLGAVFGPADQTEQFVTRYLRAQHAEMFFADAVILVEGPAERMLVPNFIRDHFNFLNSAYVTLLEIGGSHAHRLRPLIDALQIPTLVITDIDATKNSTGVPVCRREGQVTSNPTLKNWSGLPPEIDALLDASEASKVLTGDQLFAVRFAYQSPVETAIPPNLQTGIALPGTFEDALAFENVGFFASLEGDGLTRKFRDALAARLSIEETAAQLFADLKDAKKAEFALDVIASNDFSAVKVPSYISDGLEWLEGKLKKQAAATAETIVVVDPGDTDA
jgi:predicted ATP-dependent endonuclease of OLD family